MDSFQHHYDRLNHEQKSVVDTIRGPLLVLAGPGTGKTQLLSVRASNILREDPDIHPENILILTFTNAATRAMRERLAGIVGHDGYNIEVETFHSFANSIVLESEGAIKHVRDRIQISDVEKVRALEYLLDNLEGIKNLRPFGAPYIHRSEIESRISELKNEGITPGELKTLVRGIKADGVTLEDKHVDRLKELALIYEHYEKIKEPGNTELFDERGRMDYDDMILIALEAFKNDKELRDEFSSRYRYIMVDEYQDTNGAQLELLFSIMGEGEPNVCCVGDDDQSIFRFQGATLTNFRVLENKLPSVRKITLRDNYRSSQEVIEVSRQIISQVPEGERIAEKELSSRKNYAGGEIAFREFLTEEEELAFLVNEINRQAELVSGDGTLSEDQRARPYNNIAVLVRKRAQILTVIDTFLKAGIPYATDGEEDIRGEKRVRQMLDVLELARFSRADSAGKSLALYKVLTADYFKGAHSDVLKFVSFVNDKQKEALASGSPGYSAYNLFQQFREYFCVFAKDAAGEPVCPSEKESGELEISRRLGLKDPHAVHMAAWAIDRLVADAYFRPVHDILLGYINDAKIYGYILNKYEKDGVLKVRDLRSLVSFVNRVKQADISDPGIGLEEFMLEMELREVHGMPVKGEMATMSQDGVRIFTAHSSKGLEFYTVFLPFCLEGKSWPSRGKPEVIRVPADIFRSREKVEEKQKIKQLELYDELRLFYVAATRARAGLFFTATPADKAKLSRFFDKMEIEPASGSPEDEADFLAGYLLTKKKDDLFLGTEDVLGDMVERLSMNPTSLNNYITCKRKFLYDNVLRLPGKKNQHLIFGNCAHKALEEVYSEYMRTGVFPGFSVFREHFTRTLSLEGANEAMCKWCMGRLDKVADWYAEKSTSPVMPLELENKIDISMPEGLTFRGTFDKIEPDGEGCVKVIDYKTGKPDNHVKAIANCRDLRDWQCDDYYRQLIAYKMLYEKQAGVGGKTVSRGVLQFLEPTGESVKKYGMEKGAYRDEEVPLTRPMVDELEEVILECWRGIKKLEFGKLPERDDKVRCARCEYDNICWGE